MCHESFPSVTSQGYRSNVTYLHVWSKTHPRVSHGGSHGAYLYVSHDSYMYLQNVCTVSICVTWLHISYMSHDSYMQSVIRVTYRVSLCVTWLIRESSNYIYRISTCHTTPYFIYITWLIHAVIRVSMCHMTHTCILNIYTVSLFVTCVRTSMCQTTHRCMVWGGYD